MAAPKFNLYALGNNGGVEKKYKTPKEFDLKAKAYFDWCIENKQDIAINGIALFMGFYDKKGFKNYLKYEEFVPYIKRALTVVELSYELDLRSFKFGGSIFALKNLNREDWKDKTEQEVLQMITNVEATFGGATVQPTQESSTDTQLNKE